MKENIALIGFMGSGKTTVGRVLSKQLDMKFVDVDKVIAAREKQSIPDIFREFGEVYFREVERQVILEESIKNNVVISTGGGAVIDNQNMKQLEQTCFIVYLDATVDCIYERVRRNKQRPLLLEKEDLYGYIQELLGKRRYLYELSAHYKIHIDEHSNLFDTVDKIKEAYIKS